MNSVMQTFDDEPAHRTLHPWDGVIPDADLAAFDAAGFDGRSGTGQRPALLVIDMQYRSFGETPRPLLDAIAEYPTSCGEYAWSCVPHMVRLLAAFRRNRFPVIFPHVAPKGVHDAGRFGDKVPGIMEIDRRGYDFVEEVAPAAAELRIPKYHASAFFGTALTSYLIDQRIDTLFVTGGTTSGCVRASVVDASSLGFKVVVPHECVFDRSRISHAVNLFDMHKKYADVVDTDHALALLSEANALAQRGV
ncbi:isochorismatase family protein [Caballeronia sp. LZ033]|uniref:isochorismatase family protein n=1 Tax=Caballeronia sp. LZ033 TaxID=3038566 RepID=UPI002858552A|nr:isochorismatase family protein [Caballeronia sp. LZ033]MDR5815088.1 isochorismatase family protein [Caballeronia sp. LZ033]